MSKIFLKWEYWTEIERDLSSVLLGFLGLLAIDLQKITGVDHAKLSLSSTTAKHPFDKVLVVLFALGQITIDSQCLGWEFKVGPSMWGSDWNKQILWNSILMIRRHESLEKMNK